MPCWTLLPKAALGLVMKNLCSVLDRFPGFVFSALYDGVHPKTKLANCLGHFAREEECRMLHRCCCKADRPDRQDGYGPLRAHGARYVTHFCVT